MSMSHTVTTHVVVYKKIGVTFRHYLRKWIEAEDGHECIDMTNDWMRDNIVL
jgi:hypothetical protein